METREAILIHIVESLREEFLKCELDFQDVKISLSDPSKRRAGVCYYTDSENETYHIFINNNHDSLIDIIGTIIHELIHASGIKGHGKGFVNAMEFFLLEGRPTATVLSEEGIKVYTEQFEELFPMWNELNRKTPLRLKVQSTRMLKLTCNCGFICRCSRTALEKNGYPEHCGNEMELED